ncbi:MAG: pyruvate synthase subunit beta, partial [archaeon]|nr:pyruvate synthase subunit beta [archaeon]
IFCCYDNEAYMNTGVQRSGSTPFGALTTTTPILGKMEHKKDVSMIMEAHGLSYIATACASYPQDIYAKFKKAKEMKGQGLRYIHVLSPCPPGWGFDTADSIKIGRLAVKTGFWPLYEIINGKMEVSKPSKMLLDKNKRKPIEDYLKLQSRFKKINDDGKKEIQNYVNALWDKINERIS